MLIIKAINFAARKHKGQERRESGLPYLIHPMVVSELIQKYKGSSKEIHNLKCCAILHDVLEDCDCTYAELEQEFNPLVASICTELKNDEQMIGTLGKNEYLKMKMRGMTKYAFILKLVDRFSNILDNPYKGYVKHTIDLMEYLLVERTNITKRQIKIINDILTECNQILKNAELHKR